MASAAKAMCVSRLWKTSSAFARRPAGCAASSRADDVLGHSGQRECALPESLGHCPGLKRVNVTKLALDEEKVRAADPLNSRARVHSQAG